jgi:hypothetical protein
LAAKQVPWARIGYDGVFEATDSSGAEVVENRGVIAFYGRVPLPAELWLEARTRADFRWIGDEYSNRCRFRLDLSRELTIFDHTVAPYGNFEWFYDIRYDDWARTQATLGAEVTVSGGFRYEFHLARQADRVPEVRDLNALGVVAESWKRQTLLNVVRLRYADAPMFLDVASIINSHTIGGSGSAQATWVGGSNADLYGVGATGIWSNTPTVTYQPLLGDRFTKSLLQPIPPVYVFQLLQGGWPPSLVFPTVVSSVNGQRNASAGVAADSGFDERRLLFHESSEPEISVLRSSHARMAAVCWS